MIDSASSRGVAIAVLAAILVGLCVWYGALDPAPAAYDFPGEDDIRADDDQYVGERVVVAGTVVDTAPLVIELEETGGEPVRVTVTDHEADPAVGDLLRVFGVLGPDRTVRAIDTLAIPPWGLWYTWTISFLGGLWVLGRILRQWRLDTDTGGLGPRTADASEGDRRA